MKKEVKVLCIYSLLFLLLTISVFAFTITLQRPAENETIGPGTAGFPLFSVNVTIDSFANITLVNITIGGTEICSNNTVNLTEYICTWLVNETVEGKFTVLVNATNSSGGSAIDNSTNVTIDFTAPVVVINNPPNGTNTSDITPEINFTITDNLDLLINFTIFVDGIAGQTGGAQNGTDFLLNLSTLSEGQRIIVVEGRDDGGNRSNSTALTLNIDTTPPVVIDVTADPSSVNQGSSVNIIANVTDATTGVSAVLANITLPTGTTQLLTMSPLSGDLFSGTFVSTDTTGQYNITILANDTSNNLNNTETTTFTANPFTVPGTGGRGGGGGGGSARRSYITNQIGPLQITPRYSGTNVTIYSSARPYILFNDQTYSMVIRSLRSHFLEFSIGFAYYKILLGQNISIDLDKDQSDDIKIELVKTVFNSADLIVSRLNNPNDPMSMPVEEKTEEEPALAPVEEPIKEEPTTNPNTIKNKISPPPITGRATIDTPKQKSKTGLIGAVALIGLLGFLFFRFRKSNQ